MQTSLRNRIALLLLISLTGIGEAEGAPIFKKWREKRKKAKTEQAARLILDLLADGKELASEDIVKAAAEAGISERTVQNAKRNMGGILGARRVGGQWYNFLKKKQPPEPAS